MIRLAGLSRPHADLNNRALGGHLTWSQIACRHIPGRPLHILDDQKARIAQLIDRTLRKHHAGKRRTI